MIERNWRGGWFSAVHRAYPLESILPRDKGHLRALAPGERDLGSFILPTFQRPMVWTPAQKVALIESLLDELPIPPYVVNKDLESPYSYHRLLIDGQQRITTILEFIEGKFAVRGLRYTEVCYADQQWVLNRPFGCLETELRDEGKLREIYDRLAYGGTPHDPDQRADRV